MIGKLFLLNLNALFASMFSTLRRSGKRNIASGSWLKKLGFAVLAIYCGGAFITMFYGLFNSLCEQFVENGIGWLYFAAAGVVVVAMCAFTCIFSAQAQLFNARDNELLLSLPIRPSAILTARILTLLVVEFVFEALVTLPALFVWVRAGHASALGIVFFIIGFLMLPLLSLAIACLLAWILTIATARLRRKNIVTLAISVAFFGAYFWFFGSVQRIIINLLENGVEIAAAFQRALPPMYFYGKAVADSSPVDGLLMVLCCLVPFALIIALLSINFIKVATTKRGAKRVEYHEQAAVARSAVAALNRKEFAHFWSNPMLVTNMSIGSLMMLVCGVAAIIKHDMLLQMFAQLSEQLPNVTPTILLCLPLAFCAATNCASASLVSLEGRSLWIVRSLPIKARDALMAKLLFHLQIGVIPSLIASVLAAFALKVTNPAELLVIILLPILLTVLMGECGLMLNLMLPRFDWLNEVQPAKQGLPVMLLMFGSMAFVFVMAAPYVLLRNALTLTAYAWILMAVLAAVCAFLYRWIVTRGAKIFDAYEL